LTDFKDLRAWQAARSTTIEIYRLTSRLPAEERYGLSSQLRRSAVSVMANIAESSGGAPAREQRRFLNIARSSTRELESHLLLVQDLGFAPESELASIVAHLARTQRMLSRLIATTQSSR